MTLFNKLPLFLNKIHQISAVAIMMTVSSIALADQSVNIGSSQSLISEEALVSSAAYKPLISLDNLFSATPWLNDANMDSIIQDIPAQDSLLSKLKTVNQRVNKIIAFKSDIEQYGVTDYYAKPEETFKNRKGDCEDYAILKMRLLHDLGISDNVYLVHLKVVQTKEAHMVLMVKDGGKEYILDNLINSVADYQDRIDLSQPTLMLHKTGIIVGNNKIPLTASQKAATIFASIYKDENNVAIGPTN